MGKGGNVEDVIERALAAAETLREQTRLANEATKDLKLALREHRELVRQTVHDEIDATLRGHANRAMDSMLDELRQVTAMAQARVLEQIDRLYEKWIEGERQSEPTFAELMAARQALRKGMAAVERDRATAHGAGGGELDPSLKISGGPPEPG